MYDVPNRLLSRARFESSNLFYVVVLSGLKIINNIRVDWNVSSVIC